MKKLTLKEIREFPDEKLQQYYDCLTMQTQENEENCYDFAQGQLLTGSIAFTEKENEEMELITAQKIIDSKEFLNEVKKELKSRKK